MFRTTAALASPGDRGVDHRSSAGDRARLTIDPVRGLPAWIWDVPYDGARHPRTATVDSARDGANCQLFAYAVLRVVGFEMGSHRSDELWDDTLDTAHVDDERLWDLVLVNRTPDAFGAHVGVDLGDRRVLHLCAEVGRPVVWTLDELTSRDRYAVLIGRKRPIRRTSIS